VSLFAYLLSGEWTEKTFQKLNSFFWLSGCSGHAPFKSGGEKNNQPAKSFFSHIQTYCCGPTAFGWGLGWLSAPWLCEWWCSYTWDGHGMVMVVSTGNIPKGGSARKCDCTSTRRPDRSIATATNQPEKLFSLWKVCFLKEHHRDVLGKGTSPVIPQSRINEARWNVAHTN